jgi:hypothetical protein
MVTALYRELVDPMKALELEGKLTCDWTTEL